MQSRLLRSVGVSDRNNATRKSSSQRNTGLSDHNKPRHAEATKRRKHQHLTAGERTGREDLSASLSRVTELRHAGGAALGTINHVVVVAELGASAS